MYSGCRNPNCLGNVRHSRSSDHCSLYSQVRTQQKRLYVKPSEANCQGFPISAAVSPMRAMPAFEAVVARSPACWPASLLRTKFLVPSLPATSLAKLLARFFLTACLTCDKQSNRFDKTFTLPGQRMPNNNGDYERPLHRRGELRARRLQQCGRFGRSALSESPCTSGTSRTAVCA